MKNHAVALILGVLVASLALGSAGQFLLPLPAHLVPVPGPPEATPEVVVVESAPGPAPDRPPEGLPVPPSPIDGLQAAEPLGGEVDPGASGPEQAQLASVRTGKNGYVRNGRVEVILSPALQDAGVVITRQLAPLLEGECGTFGLWNTTTSNATLPPGTCANYQVLVDGAVVFATSEAVRYDGSVPDLGGLEVVEEGVREFVSGSTLYVASGADYLRPVTITARAADPESGVASVSFRSGAEEAHVAEPPWSGAVTPAPGAIVATATNEASDTDTASIDVVADGDAPRGGSISYPALAAAGETVKIVVDLGVDSESGVDASSLTVERRLAPRSAAGCEAFGSWTGVGLVDVAAEGRCAQYRLLVRDNVGNEAVFGSDAILEVPDETAPTTAIVSPEADAAVTGIATVAAEAEDVGSGIRAVTIQVARSGHDWRDLGTTTTAPYTAAWDTGSVEPGSYRLRSVAEDRAGLTAASEPIEVFVPKDVEPPTSVILTPAAGATVAGEVTVTARAEDAGSGVAELRIQVRSSHRCWSTIAEFPGDSGSVVWDTTSLRPGQYQLRAVAADRRGNSAASDPIEVTVETPEEPSAPPEKDPEPESQGEPAPPVDEPGAQEQSPPTDADEPAAAEEPAEPVQPPAPDEPEGSEEPDQPDEPDEPEEAAESDEQSADPGEVGSHADEDGVEKDADAA